MPFNRVKDVKAMVYWLLIINDKERRRRASEIPKDEKQRALVDTPGNVVYYWGLMLIPMPEAGWCLGYIDVSFWACFLYVFGSVLYFIDTFYIWYAINPDYSDDAANPANYLNTMAAVVFVWNAIACVIDWWVQLKQMGAMNLTMDEPGNENAVTLAEIPHKLSAYYFYNNVFFMGAAVIYLIQAIWWEDSSTDLQNCYPTFCGEFWINMWGSLLYLGSSWFSVLEYYEYNKSRSLSSTPSDVTLFTLDWKRLDWFGWGDWLFLATSIVAVIQVAINVFVDGSNDMYGALYMLENVLFLIDSLAYFIGYVLYMYDLEEALNTGLVSAKHAESISLLLDHMQEGGGGGTSELSSPVRRFGSISSILSGGGGGVRDSTTDRRSFGAGGGPRSGSNSDVPPRSTSRSGLEAAPAVGGVPPRSKTSFSWTADGKVSLEEVRQRFGEVQRERLSFSLNNNNNSNSNSNSRGGSRGGSMSYAVTSRVSFGARGSSSGPSGVLSRSGSSSRLDQGSSGGGPEFTVNKLYVQHEEPEDESSVF